ncbi:hypothetical protein EMIHUDRAFT_445714, partial [Emiliania huxleyi CCMP1516]|uniref:Uncharacterized protein n=2 Tax=Emiliania huxleyi TaxID=2903 RepID=A0A0D3ISR2_EMIH1
ARVAHPPGGGGDGGGGPVRGLVPDGDGLQVDHVAARGAAAGGAHHRPAGLGDDDGAHQADEGLPRHARPAVHADAGDAQRPPPPRTRTRTRPPVSQPALERTRPAVLLLLFRRRVGLLDGPRHRNDGDARQRRSQQRGVRPRPRLLLLPRPLLLRPLRGGQDHRAAPRRRRRLAAYRRDGAHALRRPLQPGRRSERRGARFPSPPARRAQRQDLTAPEAEPRGGGAAGRRSRGRALGSATRHARSSEVARGQGRGRLRCTYVYTQGFSQRGCRGAGRADAATRWSCRRCVPQSGRSRDSASYCLGRRLSR